MNDLRQAPPRNAPIFLVGFMGAGKTTVGAALAALLGYEFIDADDVIQARAGMSVPDIFSRMGEAEFRRFESDAVLSFRGFDNTVIALGGGAYTREENRDNLRSIGITVWIDCPLAVCLSRLNADGTRPLLRGEAEMKELFSKRVSDYRLADFRIDAGLLPPDQVSSAIATALGLKESGSFADTLTYQREVE